MTCRAAPSVVSRISESMHSGKPGQAQSSIQIERLSLHGVSGGVLEQLRSLYVEAYHDSRMHESLVKDISRRPAVFQMFLARLTERPGIVGAMVVESGSHSSIDYRGFPPVHSKRLCVCPVLRGKGIGRQLLAEGRRYCFDELDLKVTFGISNEIGALALHGREGALFHLESIERHSSRNSPRENVEFFDELLANKKFRAYRIPTGAGIPIVYCRDLATRTSFAEFGYVSKADMLGLP